MVTPGCVTVTILIGANDPSPRVDSILCVGYEGRGNQFRIISNLLDRDRSVVNLGKGSASLTTLGLKARVVISWFGMELILKEL